MQPLLDKFEASLDLVRLELKESKPLPSTYIQALKHLVGEFEPRELFYNKTCLVTCDIDDAHFLSKALPKCPIYMKFESEHFGFGYYFINFLENKQITALIGGIS